METPFGLKFWTIFFSPIVLHNAPQFNIPDCGFHRIQLRFPLKTASYLCFWQLALNFFGLNVFDFTWKYLENGYSSDKSHFHNLKIYIRYKLRHVKFQIWLENSISATFVVNTTHYGEHNTCCLSQTSNSISLLFIKVNFSAFGSK